MIFLYIELNGEFRLIDPFHNTQIAIEPRMVLIRDNQDLNEEFFTSLFVIFTSQTWRNASNLEIEPVLTSISHLNLNETMQQCQISDMLLQILDAYDNTNRENLLVLANKIADLLYPIESMEISIYLNCIQTFFRVKKGKLPIQIKQWLFITLAQAQSKNDHVLECVVYILLSETEEANTFYNMLTEEEKSQIDKFPIFNLMYPKDKSQSNS